MFDVFYSGIKPGLFAHERSADSLEHAQQLSRTRYFWWITYLCDYSGFDWHFQPPAWQAEYTHVWPSQHHDYSGTFLVPSRGPIQYHFHSRPVPTKPQPDRFCTLISGAEFDYSWVPHPLDPPYIYVFGNQWWPAEKMPTIEHSVPGATERKYIDYPRAILPKIPGHQWRTNFPCDWDYSWCPDPGDPPYIYIFGNQWWPAEKMATVEYHVPGATERKYMPGPIAKLAVDMALWHVPPGVDVTDMDFSWRPDPGEPPYIYQFATQHQKTGGPQYHVPGATEVKYLDMMRAAVSSEAVPIIEIDHMDGHAGQIPNTHERVRYFDNYRDTLIRLARRLQGDCEHAWVCSSVCDYTNFDFSWHPEAWQSTMLHVFASDDQKFGDTFYMHVPSFAEKAEKKALLEWSSVNFVSGRSVPRRSPPVFVHADDSHVDRVRAWSGPEPVAIFADRDPGPRIWPAVNLWREDTKAVIPLDAGAGVVVVPKTAVPYIKTQIYDYPHIDKSCRGWMQEQPLDIVFISNGESNADSNYHHLLWVLGEANHDRIHRQDGVNGRVAAYQIAAQRSRTPWFFAVFAKLRVSQTFDWTWQPDRLQQPKHYIFHARNPVNGLEYGHQAMIAYNRRMTLENTGQGLDFTLDQPHEVVPVVSGVACYDETPWMAWRTAFREVLKLRHSLPDVESEYRINRWCANGQGEFAPWSSVGAQDALEYYDEVGGDFDQLKKSYEWSWLASYALIKRNLSPDQ